MMKKALVAAGVLLLVALGGLYALLQDLERYGDSPTEPGAPDKVVTISPGQGFSSVARDLNRQGIITQPLKFKWIARQSGRDTKIQAGEYLLSPALTPRQVLDKLVSGEVRLHRLTIPEGYTLDEIAAAVAAEGFAQEAAFKKAAREPQFRDRYGIQASSLEGYLFPDTYLFPREATAEDIITAMLERFHQVFGSEWRRRAEEIGMTVHEVVTLASIIEKETGTASERPLISSVFHNRLKRGMRLETDPTVIYGIPNFNGNLTRADLATPTPYNTYIVAGLPPGPIANPGRASLEAALYPADTPYLFFVSRNDRTHEFSTSLADHNRAVNTYQKKQ
jgi:UPF0755 protein